MFRDVVTVEGVENDQIIFEGVRHCSFGKHSSVLIEHLDLIALGEVEVFLCHLSYRSIYLDRVNGGVWKQSVKGHR